MTQIDYVIRTKDKAKRYLAREPFAEQWTDTLSKALIFSSLEEAEDRRDCGDIPDAEVFELASSQRHVPRSYSFDVRVRISAMSEELAFRTLRKMVGNAHSALSWPCEENGYSKLVRIDRDGERIYGFEYDDYGNELEE